MNAIAESEFCVPHSFEQILRESGHAQKSSLQNVVPLLGGIVRSYRRCRRARHFDLKSADPAEELPWNYAAND